MWPLTKQLILEATGDTRAVPILWGPTIFYYGNIIFQFGLVIGLCIWLSFTYYRNNDPDEPETEPNHGDAKEQSKSADASSKEAEKAEKPSADNKSPKRTREEINLLLQDGERTHAHATVSDEILVKFKSKSSETKQESKKEEDEKDTIRFEHVLKPSSSDSLTSAESGHVHDSPARRSKLRVSRSGSKTPASSGITALIGASERAPHDSGSEVESEFDVTPGMSLRRRRSKRLLEVVGDGVPIH